MIIREAEHDFVMILQDDHARFSGDIAKHFKKSLFPDDPFYEDTLLAIAEHDRSWIRLDDTPVWNDQKSAPCSFMDYPLLPKIILYQLGIDEVENMSEYAALLCSMHYCSFKVFATAKHPDCQQFYANEKNRQARIKHLLQLTDEAALNRHFRLLQLCDDISLYICFNPPGTGKENEHPWYRHGFAHSERFTAVGSQPLVANWVNDQVVQITPSPFESSFSAHLRLKYVSKPSANRHGIAEAYKLADWVNQECNFIK